MSQQKSRVRVKRSSSEQYSDINTSVAKSLLDEIEIEIRSVKDMIARNTFSSYQDQEMDQRTQDVKLRLTEVRDMLVLIERGPEGQNGHGRSVLQHLRKKLAGQTKNFASILQDRTNAMSRQRDRRRLYSTNAPHA